MKQVTVEEWAEHCSNYRTTGSEQRIGGDVSWMTLAISGHAPKPWDKTGPAGAIVGRVEYRPDGSRIYWISTP